MSSVWPPPASLERGELWLLVYPPSQATFRVSVALTQGNALFKNT